MSDASRPEAGDRPGVGDRTTRGRPRRRPVARLRVLLGFLVALALLVAMGAATELLRHPAPGGGPITPPDAGDVRDEVLCPDPQPREGADREAFGDAEPGRVSSGDLLDCPQSYDGVPVLYSGEVVGAVLRRGDGAWIQINDDIYADGAGPLPAHRHYRGGNSGIGVFVHRSLADAITFVGGPAAHGDTVEVVGVFERVDERSGEVVVIRAADARITRTGRPFRHEPLRDRQVVALLLLPLAGGLVIAERMLARRR